MQKISKKLQSIKSKSLHNRTIEEEYLLAEAEKRQPLCIYCGKPLEISQTQFVSINWTWDKKKRKFIKDDSGGDADKPYCRKCETKNWDFVDFDLVNF